jgi:TorA maturation chaperone TorD
MSEAPVTFRHRLEPEDQARADFYALLARLYAAPPDAPLLAAIHAAEPLAAATHAGEGEAARLGAAWDALRAASGVIEIDAAREEYDDMFVGVGRSEVNLHASHWLTGFMMEKPLAELRATLSTLGLGRRPGVTMVEDHVAALFETMRLLIAGDGERAPRPVSDQRRGKSGGSDLPQRYHGHGSGGLGAGQPRSGGFRLPSRPSRPRRLVGVFSRSL